MDNTNKLTWEEVKEIAYRLDDVIVDHFHDTIYNVALECDKGYDFEVSDEDVLRIKEQLRLIL